MNHPKATKYSFRVQKVEGYDQLRGIHHPLKLHHCMYGLAVLKGYCHTVK